MRYAYMTAAAMLCLIGMVWFGPHGFAQQSGDENGPKILPIEENGPKILPIEEGTERKELKCVPKVARLGAPTYYVVSRLESVGELTPAFEERYYLKVTVPQPPFEQAEAKLSYFRDLGSAALAYADRGRSGYVVIYHNSGAEMALIDIHLSGQDDINTTQPVTDYICERNPQE